MRLGLFAVLYQAVLFGWHHHDLIVAGRLPMPVIEKPAAAPQIIDDEDGCEICQVLHHQTASASNGIATPPPAPTTSTFAATAPLLVDLALALAFRARAPPLV